MKVIETGIPGVLVLEPQVFEDARGYFMETWRQERYAQIGLPVTFVQDNLSFSRRGVLRGLHAQHPYGQGKLIQVPQGEVFDVVVDIRLGSPHFGRWVGVELSATNHRQLYVPPGFAHGFCATGESALLTYKCTEVFHPETELCVAWDDPDLAIDWPLAGAPILSGRDRAGLRLADIAPERLPRYEE